MNSSRRILPLLTLVLALAGSNLFAAPDSSAAGNKIFAQTLVNEACRENPDLLLVGIHAVAPGTSVQAMIACNLDRIGKKDSADDLTAAIGHRTIGVGTPKQGKFVILLPLRDAQGEFTAAALGIAFPFHAGEEETPFYGKAIAIAQRMARRLSRADQLFAPASKP